MTLILRLESCARKEFSDLNWNIGAAVVVDAAAAAAAAAPSLGWLSTNALVTFQGVISRL